MAETAETEYYLAPSLISLRNEIAEAHPERDASNDGWLGETGDHKPDEEAGGVVRALDLAVEGLDPDAVLAAVLDDSRLEYAISRGRIYLRDNEFVPQVYTGEHQFDDQVHLSLRHIKSAEKSGKWGYTGSVSADAPAAVAAAPSPWGAGQTVAVVARQVNDGEWGAGVDRVNRLQVAGYDADLVQRTADALALGTTVPEAPEQTVAETKSVSQVADEVIAGDWGNGPERSRRLQVAGYDVTEVQREVNSRVGSGTRSAVVRPSVRALAQQVIDGQWGNGPARRRRLIAAGYDADAVQSTVNSLLK